MREWASVRRADGHSPVGYSEQEELKSEINPAFVHLAERVVEKVGS